MSDSLKDTRELRKSLLGDDFKGGGLEEGTDVDSLMESNIRDPLTGLYNRRGLYSESEKVRNILKRGDSFTNFSVIVLDMIGLKKINDESTMEGGDKVLVEASDTFKKNTKRNIELASRYGGDEFVITIFNTSSKETKELIRNIKSDLQERVKFNIIFKIFDKNSSIEKSVTSVVSKIDKIKKQGPIDKTGRSIGNGIVVELTDNG